MKYDYAPYFCEENIYRLANSADVPEGWVVFIYSSSGACPVWNQRAAGEGRSVFWDYHVVYAGDGRVWDLDSVYGPDLDVDDWIAASFPLQNELPPEYRPIFRMVERADFLARFSSDRSHMRSQDAWIQPPPEWPPIFDDDHGMNLDEFRKPGPGPGVEVRSADFVEVVRASASEFA